MFCFENDDRFFRSEFPEPNTNGHSCYYYHPDDPFIFFHVSFLCCVKMKPACRYRNHRSCYIILLNILIVQKTGEPAHKDCVASAHLLYLPPPISIARQLCDKFLLLLLIAARPPRIAPAHFAN